MIEEDIQEVVKIDHEILDVVLEKQLRDWYKGHGLIFPEWFKQALLNVTWMNYCKWN